MEKVLVYFELTSNFKTRFDQKILRFDIFRQYRLIFRCFSIKTDILLDFVHFRKSMFWIFIC